MKLAQLQKLIKQGESETVEFKKSTAMMRSIFETICAFLNGKGGSILIGVNDKGALVGQDITNNTRQEIAKELYKIEPSTHPEIHYIALNESKSVIVIQVKPSHHAPYVYDGRAFLRIQSTTSKMPQHRYEQLLVIRGQLNHSWEDMPALSYTITDLDHQEIFKTVADGIKENRIPASAQQDDVEGVLRRLQLMSGSHLKNAAVVLYAKKDSLGFLQCMIKMARFKGVTKLGKFIDNQQIRDNCFGLLEASDRFLKNHLPIASHFKSDQFKRIDTPTLPVMAVREALINAICHRDYVDQSSDISLAVFDDRLEIWNSGLPVSLTLEDLRRSHESKPRNRLIANAFYVRGYIEKWGNGTNKMIDLCKEDGIPEPQFSERTGGLVVTFKFKESIGTTTSSAPPLSEITLNARQKIIFEFINETKKASVQEIIEHLLLKLDDNPAKRTVNRDLDYLKSLGLITLEGGTTKVAVWISLKSGLTFA